LRQGEVWHDATHRVDQPSAGATVGTVIVSASASDNVRVAGVPFKFDAPASPGRGYDRAPLLDFVGYLPVANGSNDPKENGKTTEHG
jgi:hypothetical protein